MTRKRLSPKKFPTKTNSGKSGSKKLAEFKKKAAARASPGESPSQYRQKVERGRASTPTPTQKTTIAEQLMPGVKSPHLLEKFIRQNKPPTPVQVTDLFPGITKKDLIGDFVASKNKDVPPKLSQAEINKIRAVHNKLPNFAGLPMSANILAALRTDLQFREMRINTREQNIDKLNDQANLELTRLNSYNKYIKNGAFVGTESQYKAYQNQFKKYENAANRYNRTIQAHNIDVKEYNKNLQNVKSKTRPAAPIAKVLSRFKQAKLYAQSKMKKPEIVQNYLQNTLANSYKVMGQSITIPKNSQQYKDWEKVMKGGLTQAQLDNRAVFYGNMYRSVYDKPLKSVGTAALFFVGGPLLKGFSTGMRALATAAKAGNKKALVLASLGKAIEGGAIGLYAGQTGKRFVEADSVAQYGYITGDVLFNEILPAGIGARYGIKVVEKLPSGVRKIRGTGTKVKTGLKEFAKSETAEVKFKKPSKTQFEAELNRLYNKAVKDAKVKTKRDLTKAELETLKSSIRRNQRAQIEDLAIKSGKAKIRQEDTLAKQISRQFKKERVQKAKKAFEQKADTLKGAAKEPTVINITRQSKNLVKKAIRLQEKYDRGQISKNTYEKQKADILKTSREIEALKKYAIEIGVDAKVSQSPKSISDAMAHTKSIISAKKNTIITSGKAAKTIISTSAALGAFTIPESLVNAITNSLVANKPLPKTKIKSFTNLRPAPVTITHIGTKTPITKKVPVKAKKPTSKPAKKPPRRPRTTTKTKPPKPLEIPKIPDMHPEKKPGKIIRRRKVTRGLDTRQFNNAVADISTIFG